MWWQSIERSDNDLMKVKVASTVFSNIRPNRSNGDRRFNRDTAIVLDTRVPNKFALARISKFEFLPFHVLLFESNSPIPIP